ncbi:hypothetical protein J2S71_000220 [Olsenella profusa DSM 13989]|uniref:TadE family protein n=1 Tax=Olsenella profusa TaxID=138595 RepID=UPI002787870B|nr:TadE family protein [Olsenella profusa]MDP9858524.1 hypothetical protein [Olsenella profusa DSM 13989]
MGEGGQATVEAALLLPAVMLVLALVLEPACMGYTYATMRAVAAQTARAVATDYDGSLGDCAQYARRRLAAVPELAPFHVGGAEDWNCQMTRDGSRVTVSIRGHVRPLPLLGVAASAFGQSDGTGVVLEATCAEQVRAEWVGGGYGEWQQMWG